MLTQKQLKIEVERITRHIKRYCNDSGFEKAIIGNSGGKDSAVVIGLMAMALGAENVITTTLPCGSSNADAEDAKLVAEAFKVCCDTIVLDKVLSSMIDAIEQGTGLKIGGEALVNLKPRLRMAALYAVAAEEKCLVIGTGNACEIYIGYFTKHGDGACDYNPLAEFTVEEVYQIARYIGVPEKILKKAPADGLGTLTDEQKLGMKYDQVTDVINTGKTDDLKVQARIEYLHKITEHKRKMPAVYHRIKNWDKYNIT